MKKTMLPLIALLGLSPGILKAQNAPSVTVTVHAAGQPLPYAYVFLNRSLYAATDSLGRALLPASDLKQGNALTFNYIGSREALLVYDGKPTYRVEVEAVGLDAVVVTAPRKVSLDKDIKNVQNASWCEEVRGDVRMQLYPDRAAAPRFAGRFLWVFIPGEHAGLSHITEFTPAGGTDSLASHFERLVEQALILVHLRPQSAYNQDSHLSYNGRSPEGLEIYTLVRRFVRKSSNHQIRLYVDPDSKIVQRMTLYQVDTRNHILQMDVAYTLSENERRLYPVRIEGTMNNPYAETVFACTISNTTLSDPINKYLKIRKQLIKEQKSKE